MASDNFKHLTGQMLPPEKFVSRKTSFDKPYLPPRNLQEHKKKLLGAMERAERQAKRQEKNKVKDATRSLFTVKIDPKSSPSIRGYGDKIHDVNVVYENKATHSVLIESPTPDLKHLRKKIEDYGTAPKQGKKILQNVPLVAPVNSIGLATFHSIRGPILKKVEKTLEKDGDEWFEASCRGGRYVDRKENLGSLKQISEALSKLKCKGIITHYEAAEKLIVFLNISLKNLQKVFRMTDCIFEAEYMPPQTFNWVYVDKLKEEAQLKFSTSQPTKSSPSIVVLDSGINSSHPSLKNCIALEESVHPEDSSPFDDDNHGTLMAGSALFGLDLVKHVQANQTQNGHHWIESIRIYKEKSKTNGDRKNRAIWATLTKDAIALSDSKGSKAKQKVFVMAVTNPLAVPGAITSWSLAADEAAYNNGNGRLFVISLGNYRPLTSTQAKNYPNENLLRKLEDPAHAINVVSVGGITYFDTMPPDATYKDYKVIAKKGQLSSHSISGSTTEKNSPIKPEIVFEAGNSAFDGMLHACDIPTLTSLSTSSDTSRGYDPFFGTSLASALCSNFAARIWSQYPQYKPETIRALMIHSASWTDAMKTQIKSKDDRLALFGYGEPDIDLALNCVTSRATVVIEDRLNNGRKVVKVKKDENGKQIKTKRLERDLKCFQLPIPHDELLELGSSTVELRVTLSYFAEPNYIGGNRYRGMDLAWDIQGPQEKLDEFLKRINDAKRTGKEPKTKGFEKWDIGPIRRRRGTIQSDRWRGSAADLAGNKLIAVYPKYGWWSERKEFQERGVDFALVITVNTPGLDIYNYVKANITVPAPVIIKT